MRTHFLILIMISCISSACKNQPKDSNEDFIPAATSDETQSTGSPELEKPVQALDKSGISVDFSDSIIVIDDEFILDALERVLDLKVVMQKSEVLRRKTLPNKFDENQTDTIITLIRSRRDGFEYYVSPVNATLLVADIKSTDIIFRGNIGNGTPRMDVLGTFMIKKLVDRLIVTDLERYNEFEFQFKQDTLRRITFISRYLD